MVLSRPCNLLVLDEPTNDLDLAQRVALATIRRHGHDQLRPMVTDDAQWFSHSSDTAGSARPWAASGGSRLLAWAVRSERPGILRS
jgi:hypothetical protein